MVPPTLKHDPIRRVTLVDEIAERLRYQLMIGAIPPGTRILARDLETQYGVSHIPIREALRHLEAEGMVRSGPHGQTVAASVGLEELADIWGVRRLVETQVARRAAGKFTPRDLEEIDDSIAVLRKTVHDPRSRPFLAAHRSLHWSILAPGASPWMHRILDQLWQGSDRYIQLFARTSPFDREFFMSQHMKLVTACRDNDPAALESAVVEHVDRTEQDVRAGYLEARGGHELAAAREDQPITLRRAKA
jgi:DNA-binding GntR family transcriptional regulator